MKKKTFFFVTALLGVCILFLGNWRGMAAEANDQVSGAIVIGTSNYTNNQSTVSATSTGDPVLSCLVGFGNGVWYQFTPDSNGHLIVDTIGSDFDTGLGIYFLSEGASSLVACDDDGGGNSSSRITTSLTAGMTYYILAGGYAGATGNLSFHLAFMPTAPPTSLRIQMQGGVASLTINGSVKASYEIQYSTDLSNPSNWATLTGVALPSSPYVLNDFNSSNRPMTFYRTVLRGPAVSAPRIGWVAFYMNQFGVYVSFLVTNQPNPSFTFDNDATIAILTRDGTGTHYTSGPTPVGPDDIPEPSPSVGATPPFYLNGPYGLPVSIIAPQPDVTIKAISFQTGRLNSPVVTARYRFETADPVIQGTNAASFTVTSATTNALMWFTIDGSDPTDGPPSIGPLPFNGANLSFTNSNFTFKIRAFRNDYAPSDVVSKVF